MRQTAGGSTVELESPSLAPSIPSPHPVVAPAPRAQPHHTANRWLLVIMLVLCGTFAGALVKFVLFPASARVAGVPATGAHSEGP